MTLTDLHRSFGLLAGTIMLGRFVWRRFAKHPNFPADLPLVMRLAAVGTEYTLYGFMLAQPVLGLLYTNARGDRVNFFFLGQIPALIGKDRPLSRTLHEAHEWLGFALLVLIAMHIGAALFHHFVRRDNILRSMLSPGR